MGALSERFNAMLTAATTELYADNPGVMRTPNLLPTRNVIDDGDLELFFLGIDSGLITMARGGKFNTFDRPKAGGRWSLLSGSRDGGWYNAEYLPQLAGYVDAIVNYGYAKERVLFELPAQALQLDLAILDDVGRVVVLGEAKRSSHMLTKLVTAVESRFSTKTPGPESKKRGDEARQLAWRLWVAKPGICWLIGPGERHAYGCQYEPLRMRLEGLLPTARHLLLDHPPPQLLAPPRLV